MNTDTHSNKNLGKMLRQRRVMSGLTAQELAVATGISRSHIGRIERGERFPSAHILQLMSEPLGISQNQMFQLAGYLSARQPSAPAELESGRLDPYVAYALSSETYDVQRGALVILSVLKRMANGINDEGLTSER